MVEFNYFHQAYTRSYGRYQVSDKPLQDEYILNFLQYECVIYLREKFQLHMCIVCVNGGYGSRAWRRRLSSTLSMFNS